MKSNSDRHNIIAFNNKDMSVHFGFSAADIVRHGQVNQTEIDIIRDWNGKYEDIPQLTEEQIVVFLLSCERDLELTQKTITEYYQIKLSAPEIFNDKYMNGEIFWTPVIETAVCPKRTEDGAVIAIARLKDFDYRKWILKDCLKMCFMVIETLVYDDPPNSLVVLFDMTGFGFMHLTQLKIHLVKLICRYAQGGIQVKLKTVHVLNGNWLAKKILALITPFLDRRIIEKIKIHGVDLNMEEFYEKHIPKSCLPIDYGGDLLEIKVLHADVIKKLQDMKPYFLEEENQRKTIGKRI